MEVDDVFLWPNETDKERVGAFHVSDRFPAVAVGMMYSTIRNTRQSRSNRPHYTRKAGPSQAINVRSGNPGQAAIAKRARMC